MNEIHLYISGNRSCASVTDELGVNQNTVYKWVLHVLHFYEFRAIPARQRYIFPPDRQPNRQNFKITATNTKGFQPRMAGSPLFLRFIYLHMF